MVRTKECDGSKVTTTKTYMYINAKKYVSTNESNGLLLHVGVELNIVINKVETWTIVKKAINMGLKVRQDDEAKNFILLLLRYGC